MPSPVAPSSRAYSDGIPETWELTNLITRLRRALRAGIRTDIPWETLPMAQVEILQRLTDEPGMRISELARRQRLATNTVSTLIQQMVVAGLVERESDPNDRRAVSLTLTQRGEESLDGWLRANKTRLDAALRRLSAQQRAAVAKALPALAALAEQLEHLESEE